MELITLDNEFQPDRQIDIYNSLIWTERYSSNGDFELTSNDISGIMNLLPEGRCVSLRESTVPMLVETHKIVKGPRQAPLIQVMGRAFETVLERRLSVKDLPEDYSSGVKAPWTVSSAQPSDTAYKVMRIVISDPKDRYIDDELVLTAIPDPAVSPEDRIPELDLVLPADYKSYADEWSPSKVYSPGEVVLYKGFYYSAVRPPDAKPGEQPTGLQREVMTVSYAAWGKWKDTGDVTACRTSAPTGGLTSEKDVHGNETKQFRRVTRKGDGCGPGLNRYYKQERVRKLSHKIYSWVDDGTVLGRYQYFTGRTKDVYRGWDESLWEKVAIQPWNQADHYPRGSVVLWGAQLWINTSDIPNSRPPNDLRWKLYQGSTTDNLPAWTPTGNYVKGKIVRYNKKRYEATTTVPSNPKPGVNSSWVRYDKAPLDRSKTYKAGDLVYIDPDIWRARTGLTSQAPDVSPKQWLKMFDEIKRGYLYDTVRELINTNHHGLKSVRPRPGENQVGIEIYNGADLTREVVFSAQFDQLDEATYLLSRRGSANVAYIYGSNGSQRVLKNNAVEPSGLERRLLLVDEENDSALLTVDNRNSRALIELYKYNATAIFDGRVSDQIASGYNKHYHLGDIVRLVGEYGLSADVRVEEFIRSVDSSGYKAYPAFSAIE